MLLTTTGAGLTAVVDPGRGGKIVSLVDGAGREWLARASGPSPAGLAFTDAEMAGWDECAPSIVACEWDGHEIPDHGDLWDSVFEADGDTVIGRGDGYLLERRMSPTADGLRISYRATAERAMPFLWAAHPQFSAPEGTIVRLPSGPHTVIDVLAPGLDRSQWSASLAGLDTVAPGAGRKLYLDPDSPVFTAALERPDGASLVLRWSPECPYLGLWFDNRAYSREPVIALEPSTGYYDSLTSAVAAGRVARLEPGVPFEWWVELAASG